MKQLTNWLDNNVCRLCTLICFSYILSKTSSFEEFLLIAGFLGATFGLGVLAALEYLGQQEND